MSLQIAEKRFMDEVVAMESKSRDTIDVKRIYVNAAGDLVAGILFSQILYWFLPKGDGRQRVTINRDGRLWLAKKREDWWDECCISPKQYDRAIVILKSQGLVDTEVFKFAGSPTSHVTINWQKVYEIWSHSGVDREFPNSPKVNLDIPQRSISKFPKGQFPYTETTAEITTEITTENITPIPPEGATTATTENHSQQDSPEDQYTDDIPIWDKPQEAQVEAQEKPADPPKAPKPDSITPQMINRFVEIWNEHAVNNGWRTSRALSESRKRAIRARLKDKIFNENFIAALKHMAKDRFFSGSNDRQWVANIDYFLQPKSFDKLMDRMGGDGNIGKKAGPPKWKDALLFICREHPDEVERYRGIENCGSFDDLPPDISIKVKSVITYGSIYGGGNL